MKRRFFRIVSIATLGIFCLSINSCKDQNRTIEPIIITFKKEGKLVIKKASNDSIIRSLDIEIADSEYETQTGMMYRDTMEDNQGMLFVFQKPAFHSFYMKNTSISLDIIYFSADKKIVSIRKNAKPFDETSLSSDAPTQYVLEVNAGLSDVWKLEVGDKIEYSSQ